MKMLIGVPHNGFISAPTADWLTNIASKYGDVWMARSQGPFGVIIGRNKIAQRTVNKKYDWCCMVDTDVVPPSCWKEVVKEYLDRPRVIHFSIRTRIPFGASIEKRTQILAGQVETFYKNAGECRLVCGIDVNSSVLLIHREVLEQIRLLPTWNPNRGWFYVDLQEQGTKISDDGHEDHRFGKAAQAAGYLPQRVVGQYAAHHTVTDISAELQATSRLVIEEDI